MILEQVRPTTGLPRCEPCRDNVNCKIGRFDPLTPAGGAPLFSVALRHIIVSPRSKSKMSDEKNLRVLGGRIRRLRLAKGISQERLAELAGIHENHLRRVELGQANPTYLVLLRISDALEIALLELLAEAVPRRSG